MYVFDAGTLHQTKMLLWEVGGAIVLGRKLDSSESIVLRLDSEGMI